jgi:23S rRNA (uracil1939-C5)-methyltransferase
VGDTHIRQTLFDKSFRVTAGTQFRTNPPQIEKMIEVVADYLNPQADDLILDLYGGAGVFSAFIAPLVSFVTYVDSYPPAATDAEDNLAHCENIDIIEGTVEEVLADIIEDEETFFHSAIIDPTRHGLTPEAIDGITALNIARLVYVSQDPTKFARDAKQLVDNHGYKLVKIQPIDFDPQTYRIQSVALFERESE